MDTCMCTAESLHCSSETITTLLISDTPIQNKKFKVWGGDWQECGELESLHMNW